MANLSQISTNRGESESQGIIIHLLETTAIKLT